jgi:predicted transcriptional regulator of viral defense system
MEGKSRFELVSLARCAVARQTLGRQRAAIAVARLQHGVISRAQLIAIGFTAAGIDSRVTRGSLRGVHQGVYVLGAVTTALADECAAVLACGPRAYVSHHSAAALFGVLNARREQVQVTVVGRCVRRARIDVHRVARMHEDEVTVRAGIPVTTASRTILDLAAKAVDLEYLLAEAYARSLTTRSKLLSLIVRYPSRPGIRRLRKLLDAEPQRTRSDPERNSSHEPARLRARPAKGR